MPFTPEAGSGTAADPLAGYTVPGHGSPPPGAGLWAARQACDTLEAFPTPTGFTVRLTTALPGPATGSGLASRAASAADGRARA